MKYQVITITNERILIETFNEQKAAFSYFKCAKYGCREDEEIEKIYLTINNQIVIEDEFNN